MTKASDSTRADVDQIIAELLFIEDHRIRPDARLLDDLEIDSLDLVELAVALEGAFDVELDDAKVKTWVLVEDVYHAVGVDA